YRQSVVATRRAASRKRGSIDGRDGLARLRLSNGQGGLVAALFCSDPSFRRGGAKAESQRSGWWLRAHFFVELGHGAADAEAPGEDGIGFEFVGDDVLIESVGDRDAGLVHLFGLCAEIVEYIA